MGALELPLQPLALPQARSPPLWGLAVPSLTPQCPGWVLPLPCGAGVLGLQFPPAAEPRAQQRLRPADARLLDTPAESPVQPSPARWEGAGTGVQGEMLKAHTERSLPTPPRSCGLLAARVSRSLHTWGRPPIVSDRGTSCPRGCPCLGRGQDLLLALRAPFPPAPSPPTPVLPVDPGAAKEGSASLPLNTPAPPAPCFRSRPRAGPSRARSPLPRSSAAGQEPGRCVSARADRTSFIQ